MNVVEKLQSLVRIPSLSCEEDEIAKWIQEHLVSQGIAAEIRDRNVICRFEGEDSSRAVIFNGHTDTVEAGELELWKHPPTGDAAGVIEDEKVYGLGSSDMKASLASYMELAEKYQKEKPPVDIFFSFVTEEEVSGRGSINYVNYFQSEWQSKYSDVICIVGEPTGFEYVEIGNRGVHFFELVVEGEACHASQAAGKKTNAPELALEALNKMEQLKERWIEEYSHEMLGAPAVTITAMNSSVSSPNSVPSIVTLRWDIRTTPKLHKVIEAELREEFSKLGTLRGVREPCPCAFCPLDSTLLQAFKKALPKVEHRIARGGNDCGMFIEAGIPAVTFGPGKKEVIHQVNEYAPLAELQMACERYTSVVEAFAR